MAVEDHSLRGVSAIMAPLKIQPETSLGAHLPRWTAGDSGLFQGTSPQPRSSTTMVTMCGGDRLAHENRDATRRSLMLTDLLFLYHQLVVTIVTVQEVCDLHTSECRVPVPVVCAWVGARE